MKIGIIPNYLKSDILNIVDDLISKLIKANINFAFSESVNKIESVPIEYWEKYQLYNDEELANSCEVVVSIGGDGTLLRAAYNLRKSGTPLVGVNFGKLGFLAEFDTSKIDELVDYLLSDSMVIEKRNALDAICLSEESENLYAINDIVIDRGNYPKMIEITIEIDNEYVSTFSADGIILATPTGSTGYSLSTGGPIVNPQTESITLSPISAHTLAMRPLVISSNQKVVIIAQSPLESVQVICDGQRVSYLKSPAKIEITKSKFDLKLVHNKKKHYFEILRQKLYWGLDLRTNNGKVK